MSQKRQLGFSLIEILVSVFIAAIALLGLAAGEINSLRFANNSFNHSLSIIQANNAIEKLWVNICELQDGRQAYDSTFRNSIYAPQVSTFEVVTSPATTFNNVIEVTVSWQDLRMTDNLQSQIQLNATYPQLPAGC